MMISMRGSQAWAVTQVLVLFVFKLCTGNPNKILASILQL